MDVLRTFHAHNKFLVLLLLAVTAAVLLVNAARGREHGKLQRALFSATHGWMGVQVLVGTALVFHLGLLPYRIEHLGTMLIAFGLMHVPLKWKRETGPERSRKTGLVVLGVLALIVVGILRLPFPFFGLPHAAASAPAAVSAPATTP